MGSVRSFGIDKSVNVGAYNLTFLIQSAFMVVSDYDIASGIRKNVGCMKTAGAAIYRKHACKIYKPVGLGSMARLRRPQRG